MVALTQDMVTMNGRPGVDHIPRQPLWLFIVRCFQLLLAIIILALSAYAGSAYYTWYAGDGIGIFSFVWTFLFLAYIECSTFFLPAAYNKYIHLVLECLCVIFWLATFAALAAVAAVWNFGYVGVIDTGVNCSYDLYGDYICVKLRGRSYNYSAAGNATKAAAALGAIEWVLFVGTLISYGIYLHRNRRAALEARQQGIQGGAVVEEHKMGPVVTQQPVQYVQQPVQYAPAPQQPVYTQAPADPRYQQGNMA